MTRHATDSVAAHPVPTRKPQGRSLPVGWRLVDIHELTTRLQHLGIAEGDITVWLEQLAERGVRNPARYTRRLSDDELRADVTNTLAPQRDPGRVFVGHLDYSRNYRRPSRRQVVTSR